MWKTARLLQSWRSKRTARSDEYPNASLLPPWTTVTGVIVSQLGELWSGGCEILDAISPLIA
jgi:hypothetical protein